MTNLKHDPKTLQEFEKMKARFPELNVKLLLLRKCPECGQPLNKPRSVIDVRPARRKHRISN